MVFCLPSRKPPTWLEESTAEKHKSAQRDLARQEVDLAGLTNTQRQLKEEALHNLQALMEENKVDVYVVPSEDEHLSEIPSPADRRLKFITGFTGSAGTALVRRESADIYVDSRYWAQAPTQVSKSWSVRRVGDAGQKSWAEDLISSVEKDSLRVGIDPRLISAASGGAHSASVGPLLSASNLTVVPIAKNLVDEVWVGQPARSSSKINLHPLKFAGKRSAVKMQELIESPTFKQDGVRGKGMLVSALDEIIWLLNLRGTDDVPMTPVFYAYLWIPFVLGGLAAHTDSRILFVDPSKISSDVKTYLASVQIVVKPYSDVWDFLGDVKSSLGTEEKGRTEKVFTGAALSWAVELALGKDNVCSVLSPIAEAKAIKNDVEISGFKAAYLRDGRATVRWMARMDALINKEGKLVDEYEATVLHTCFRKQEEHYAGPAYGDISGSGPNGALPHYEPVEGNCRVIDRQTPYVNDSGSQYLDGTIDTTRTLHFGSPTKEQKRAFTRVLQGHMAVINTVLPAGKSGVDLNSIARAPLWKEQLDFGHGVGHGVGQFGVVHEGPQGIALPYPFKPGHVVTCEPGYYKEGHFGIRIESLILCAKLQKTSDYGGDWLGFELITRVPIATNLVDSSILSPSETKWLREHNELCKREIMPLLTGPKDSEARKWLKKQ